MKTWSDSPFVGLEQLAGLRQGTVVAGENGESRLVYELADHPGWLAKLYKHPLPADRAEALRRLVYLPTVMSPDERAVVDAGISWPVARIADGSEIVGVLMAKAPERFWARLTTPSGTQPAEPLPLDWLVHGDEICRKRGLTPATGEVRMRAMLQLLAVGALFARHDLVYADWSYRNCLWDQGSGDVFVIDMDTCGTGTREWVESPKWADPLFRDRSRPLTVLSDRYKIALMAVRCLTGVRDEDGRQAFRTLTRMLGDNRFTGELGRALTAVDPHDRPAPEDLLAALRATADGTSAPAGTGSSNVTGRVKVGPGVARARPAGDRNVTGTVPVGGPRAGRQAPQRHPAPEPVATTPAPVQTRAEPATQGGGCSTLTMLLVLAAVAYCVAHFGFGLL